jgi:D-arabinose 1-dehydrogenase-like Zn-dependent alcohol dehydrogenase
LIGVLTGRQGEVATAALIAKQARLQGLMVGSRRHQQDYVAALEQSGVRPVLDSSFSLDQLADAGGWNPETDCVKKVQKNQWSG